ncbi:MAG: alkaline phosphatase family protein [Candidatus Marsarchaeota archaeon]|nr:alkaline phosphatase family protein [Candidatus Marsarchaeota archaeon]MCL5106112.1 alkaline phosphatase family protein [Candidatus Marsarchaeota archaeon]
MNSLKKEIEDSGLAFPDYKNSNLSLVNEMANKKGIFSKKDKILFILIDALGFKLLNKIADSDRIIQGMLRDAEIRKISSIFPSFTPCVIASLESGVSIAEHGIISGRIPVKERGTYVNVFDTPWWPKESDIKKKGAFSELFPAPNNIYKLSKNYKKFFIVTPEAVWKKNQNTTVVNKINSKAFISLQDMIIQIKKLMRNKSEFIYAYTDIVDHTQHVYANSYETLELTRLALRDLQGVIAEAEKLGYLVVITADHGQVSLSKKNILWVKPNSNLMRYASMPPWGSRAMFMSIMPGMFEKFEALFEKKYADYLLIKSDEAIKQGLFGKSSVQDSIRNRFGTHIAIPKRSDGGMFFSFSEPKNKINILGHHGGLNKEEMEIPLILL